ncbi:hypothetical protein OO009_13230 [Flavobacteriaceae bacterium KMM 6897]|nr:hypothetical protein [Flavobacteriaceae bacterium KMM 6897]MEB8347196.1 hypothetical protein [Flavobacteriaceae bacterium KMM 6898]
MTPTNVLPRILMAILAMLVISCNKDSNSDLPGDGTISLAAKASYTGLTNKGTTAKTNNAEVVLSSFLVNIKEIEFEIDNEFENEDNSDSDHDDQDYDDNGYYDHEDEIELEGPFELDLLNGSLTFVDVQIPNGNYEEIEFKFDVNKNEASPLFNKTILLTGTIDTVPFEFWYAFEEEIEIDFEDSLSDIIIENSNNKVTINFNLDMVIANIDLSTAQDGNGNGLIEIHPNDEDGNRELADLLKNKIKEYADLLDD